MRRTISCGSSPRAMTPLCLSPIRFGLTPVPGRHAPRGFFNFIWKTGAVGRVFANDEVAKMIDMVGLLSRTNKESLVIFPVPEYFLGSRSTVVSKRVHPEKNYVELEGFWAKPPKS